KHRGFRFAASGLRVPRPGERALQPIVTPEQLAVGGHEARRPEYAEPLRLFHLLPQLRFEQPRARRPHHTLRIVDQWCENAADGGDVVDAAALAEFGMEDSSAELLAPTPVNPNQRHPRPP